MPLGDFCCSPVTQAFAVSGNCASTATRAGGRGEPADGPAAAGEDADVAADVLERRDAGGGVWAAGAWPMTGRRASAVPASASEEVVRNGDDQRT